MNTPRKPAPSWKTMEETLREWHEQSLNDPEYLWLAPNFEDIADEVSKAIFCANVPRDMTPYDKWQGKQQEAGA